MRGTGTGRMLGALVTEAGTKIAKPAKLAKASWLFWKNRLSVAALHNQDPTGCFDVHAVTLGQIQVPNRADVTRHRESTRTDS
jgi:hypothetical protein